MTVPSPAELVQRRRTLPCHLLKGHWLLGSPDTCTHHFNKENLSLSTDEGVVSAICLDLWFVSDTGQVLLPPFNSKFSSPTRRRRVRKPCRWRLSIEEDKQPGQTAHRQETFWLNINKPNNKEHFFAWAIKHISWHL